MNSYKNRITFALFFFSNKLKTETEALTYLRIMLSGAFAKNGNNSVFSEPKHRF